MVTLSPCQTAQTTGSIWDERGFPAPASYLFAGSDLSGLEHKLSFSGSTVTM